MVHRIVIIARLLLVALGLLPTRPAEVAAIIVCLKASKYKTLFDYTRKCI